MSTESRYHTLQGFESSSTIQKENSNIFEKLPNSDNSLPPNYPPLPNRFSDIYGINDRIASLDQRDPSGPFSNTEMLGVGYADGSHSMILGDTMGSYSMYGGRQSLLPSESADYSTFESTRLSCVGSEYDSSRMSFNDSRPGYRYPMQRNTTQFSANFDGDFVSNTPYDTHADTFLYSSQGLPSQSSLLNAPPLPPRTYLSSDYPTTLSSQLTGYHSINTEYPPSTRSSASLSSPQHQRYWNRTMESTRRSFISSPLTATAPPFVVSTQAKAYGKEEEKKPDGGEGKEKKKGSGEDVDLNKLLSGEETRSAVMIRNIPNRFSKEELCDILNHIVPDKYTILNMPLDSKTHRNLGYSFIQFKSIEDLITAYKELQGKKWPNSESMKRCRFCYAKIQGDPNTSNPSNLTTVANMENGEVVKEE